MSDNSTPEDTTEDATGPGDAQGVPVPSEDAVEGSSQELKAVDGVREHPDDPEPEESSGAGRTF